MKFLNKWIVGLAILSLSLVALAHADKAWDQYLNLNPTQKPQLKSAQQARGGAAKPAQEDKESAVQNLMNQVLANAGDSAIQPILSQILGDMKTIDGAEDGFWQTLNGFLTPTQVAKIYLKGHPPKQPASTSPAPAQKPANPQPSFNWGVYFGLTKDQQTQLKSADQGKNTQMKSTREEVEAAVEQLNQLVQSNAADSSIQTTLTTLFSDIQAEHTTEQTFWGTTLPAFLSSTQVAKLFLHRHAPKGGFNPPAPAGSSPVTPH